MTATRHCMLIAKLDPNEEPVECTLTEVAAKLQLPADKINWGFIEHGRFDTDSHVVVPLSLEVEC